MDDQKQKENKENKKAQEQAAKDTAVEAQEGKEVEALEETADSQIEEAESKPESEPANVSAKGKTLGFNDFRVGDTIRVFYKIIEGDKLRTQPYEGIVISKRGEGNSKSFTVRRMGADNVGIERIFPAYTPNIDSIKLVKKGKVRRAKLYYLRSKVGRAAMRVKEIKK